MFQGRLFAFLKVVLVSILLLISSYIFVGNVISKSKSNSGVFKLAPNVQLGLDIVGGSQLLLSVDLDRFLDEKYASLVADFKNSLWEEKVRYNSFAFDRVNKRINIDANQDNNTAISDIKKIAYKIDSNLIVNQSKSDNKISIYYSEDYIKSMIGKVTDYSMKIVQKRIDSTGTKEIVMYRAGRDKIMLQVPGIDNPEKLKRILGRTARLSFHLLDESNPIVRDNSFFVGEGRVLLRGHSDGKSDIFYNIIKRPVITGDNLVDAHPSFDNLKVGIVFRFNSVGARKFANVTTEHTGKPFAIVLDDEVLTAPMINEPITGGSGVITGNFSAEEARELSDALRSGALPAKINIIEERVIGPSIGSSAIRSATFASVIGIGLLMLFMFLYYGYLGLIANFAILMNLTCVVAIMAIFKFSITLPGIAGLILTLGMSIDANVLIYERIRDELRKRNNDKFDVIQQGFKGSFSAIIDSNITTILSAIALVTIGSGFVRGFSITLIFGLLTSLFTSITFTRMMILWLAKFKKIDLFRRLHA